MAENNDNTANSTQFQLKLPTGAELGNKPLYTCTVEPVAIGRGLQSILNQIRIILASSSPPAEREKKTLQTVIIALNK